MRLGMLDGLLSLLDVSGIFCLAFALALALALFCKTRILRWLMGLHMALVVALLPARFYVYDFVISQGCIGDGGFKGLHCPEYTGPIKFAMFHFELSVLGFFYFFFVFPFVLAGALIIELIARRFRAR